MKAIIIDDEQLGADNLRILLEEHCPAIELCGICHDPDEGVKLVQAQRPELLFLDIEMPFTDGFSVLAKLTDWRPHVIFTTAYEQYAVQAFRVEAADYLLKPVDAAELKAAVDKVLRKSKENDPLIQRIELLTEKLGEWKQKKIAIHSVDGFRLVSCEDVIRLEASSNYTHIYCVGGKKHTVARLLKEYEEQLTPQGFMRIHSSHLVNLSHITQYLRGDGGYVVMSDGEQLEVSRRKKNDLLKVLTGG